MNQVGHLSNPLTVIKEVQADREPLPSTWHHHYNEMMRTTALALLATLFLAQFSSAQDFYDIGTINSIEITFEEENWDEILDGLYAAGDEERLVATAVINGVQFDSVGVRYKGNSTYSANRTKNPFNIKLDHIIDDQELDGYGTLKLANVYNDPSFVRETLGYAIARKYMPASRANYIRVTINGTLIGLYTSVQSVDKHFLGTNLQSNDNAFFKGELLGNNATDDPVWGYAGDDSTAYFNLYEMKSDDGWSDLMNFLNVLNNDVENVEEVLNVDRHLWMLAFDNLMVNLDAPINFAHNYYLYRDDAGQFNPIVWDLNESFGVFTRLLNSGGGGGLNLTGSQQFDPFFNATNSAFPIVRQILSNPLYQRMYIAHMKTMIEENFSNGWYQEEISAMQETIAGDVEADPNKFYTTADFRNNVSSSISGGGGPRGRSIVGLTELMEGRVAYLLERSEFTADAPQIADPAHDLDLNRTITITADISNATNAWVYVRTSRIERFTPMMMLDDGTGGDETADDGVYSVEVQANPNATVEYYLYADNGEAGIFSPQRAAHEFYSLSVPGSVDGVVINEFMASNDTTVADQDGDFDDWIELYNNSAEPISLTGYYLTDDGTDLTQWKFPEAVIPAGGYLIVWADDDEDQEGLHANFKLSASGETVLLLDPEENVVDEVTFGEQETDVSYGRFPNGTGEFRTMPTTFNAENVSESSSVGDQAAALFAAGLNMRVAPNPMTTNTTFSFTLSERSDVSILVYDTHGRQVRELHSGALSAGDHRVDWEGSTDLVPGVYHYVLSVDGASVNGRIVLVR